MAARMVREAHRMLDPFVNIISKNNDYAAMYGASAKLKDKKEEDNIENYFSKWDSKNKRRVKIQ